MILRHVLGIISRQWTGIEVVITALTRNQVVRQRARGFESHPVRHKRTVILIELPFFSFYAMMNVETRPTACLYFWMTIGNQVDKSGFIRGTLHGRDIFSFSRTVLHCHLVADEVHCVEATGTDQLEKRSCFAPDVYQSCSHYPLCAFPEGNGKRTCAAVGF